MSDENRKCVCECVGAERLQREFQHLRSDWWWLLLYGVLLALCGTVAIIVPALTFVAALIVLGVALMVGGVATIVMSFWAGKWSGMLVQLLVGVLYIVAAFTIFDTPVKATKVLILFVVGYFIVVGAYRILAALMIKFPNWGWALLNGIVTLLLGMIIYRHFHDYEAVWILGLLIGLEMLFNGWTWIMLSLAVRSIPEKTAA